MTNDDDGWTVRRRSLGAQLLVAQRHFADAFHARMDAAGFADVRPGAGNLLEHLGPAGSTVAAMAQRAGITPQAMVQVVDDLEAKGYVGRIASPTDRRAKLVRLTARGKRMIDKAAGILGELEAGLATRLGSKRFTELRKMLDEIADGQNYG